MSGAERRLNLLSGDWVLVSPDRAVRPWQGEVAARAPARPPAHDPACHLCPGNARASGAVNPRYAGVYVFDNDFPALNSEAGEPSDDPLLTAAPETGVCRVVCYSPDHGESLATMPVAAIRDVVDAWAGQTDELAARPDIAAVTVFENKGEMMGASSPHPHGQIWATSSVPNELAREDERQRAYAVEHGRPLLAAYLERERAAETRLVFANDGFVVLVPYWAIWPFETLVLPRRPVSRLPEMSGDERDALAEALAVLTRAYDALFNAPFPYSMGFHQAPATGADAAHFVLHGHVYPPLLRSAAIRKFMVGFELLAMPQRDLTPEAAAARLRQALERSQG
ncbi:MAG TPA: UDP-glucose--hexose-1-phosphate uridylyltransferase [Caulobacteraceae bacterium]|nr:UDP-glucose--hexose-1-phosphate uridylyltransferase [Caulobacteraceae bacterium]